MKADGPGSSTYCCQIDNVPEQPYQYKVRIGDRWVLDDDMPVAQDRVGNHNNVGYTEHVPRKSTSSSPGRLSAMVDREPVRHEVQKTSNRNFLLPLVYIPPLDNGHVQSDMRSIPSQVVSARHTPNVRDESSHRIEPSAGPDQEAPLLTHEYFQQEPDRLHPNDEFRPCSGPRSPPMSTIQEETTTNSDGGGTESQPGTPSSLEQARKYQRALIEAMPASVADGFTRASVLFPVRPPDEVSELNNTPLMHHETMTSQGGVPHAEQQDELSHAPLMRHETDLGQIDNSQRRPDADELDHAPLMRHETNVASSANSEQDDSGHAPLIQFETNLNPEASYVDSAERRVSYGTTLVDEENDADDELSHAPLMRHETMNGRFDGSEQSSLYSERMMFPMETSNPPTLVGPPRASSVYSHNALNIAPVPSHELPDWYVSDESAFNDWIDPRAAPDYNADIVYYEGEDSSDVESDEDLSRAPTMPQEVSDELVDELDRAPTLPHEASIGSFSIGLQMSELEMAPMLQHELQNADDPMSLTGADGTSSERRGENTSEGDAASQRSKARRIMSGEDAFLSTSKTNSFTSERLQEAFKNRIFGATRRPAFSQDVAGENNFDFGGTPLLAHERIHTLSDRSSSDSLSSNWRYQGAEIPDFPTFARRSSTIIFRFPRSNLPHRIPRSDEEDLDLRDPSLEIFPMDRDQVFGRVRDISNRLAEDQVLSPTDHPDSPAVVSHAGSSVNLAPIRSSSTMSLRSIRENESENEDESRLPSPVLMLASRVPKSSPIAVPRIPTRRHTEVIHEETEDPEPANSKRHAKIFDTIALPPQPPKANVALPPRLSFSEPDDVNKTSNARERCRTPYPEGIPSDEENDQSGNIAQKLCAHFRACFPSRNASIVSVGILVAGAAWLWKRWT